MQVVVVVVVERVSTSLRRCDDIGANDRAVAQVRLCRRWRALSARTHQQHERFRHEKVAHLQTTQQKLKQDELRYKSNKQKALQRALLNSNLQFSLSICCLSTNIGPSALLCKQKLGATFFNFIILTKQHKSIYHIVHLFNVA